MTIEDKLKLRKPVKVFTFNFQFGLNTKTSEKTETYNIVLSLL